MSARIIPFDYQGQAVMLNAVGWINATEAAARLDKEPAQWLRLPDAIRYLALHGGTKGAELEAKGLCHFEDGGEFDVSITGQRLIQGFKPNTGITRQLIHALRTKNSAERLCDKRRVAFCILNARIKVKNHVLISLEELRDVPIFQFDVTHKDLLKPSSNVEGGLNTFRLGGPIATCEHIVNYENGFPGSTLLYGIRRMGRSLPFRNSRLFPTVAKFDQRRYRLPVAANSVTRVWSLDNAKGAQAPHKNAGAFFVPVISSYGGCVWEAFAPAGFLLPRLTNPHTVRLHSFGHEGGGSPAKGAVPMQHIISLNPSKIRALAHRRMALSALRADSSLAVRLKRYNDHMTIVRALEVQGGAE